MCASGPEQMMADGSYAAAHEPAWSSWRAEALWLLGEAHLLAGHIDEARGILVEASAAAATTGNPDTIAVCESELALQAMDRADWEEAAGRLERARATIDEKGMYDRVKCLLAFAGGARLSVRRGNVAEAHCQLAQAMRARPSATYVLPFLAVRLRLQLAKMYLAIPELPTARQLLREIDDILVHRAALGNLAEEAERLRSVLASSTAPGGTGRPPLTPAELRLLPYLQTHLTADGIAERLFLSSHTVKTQVKSIYRKLGVSSRNDAVQMAAKLGLLAA
jgi:LuxR family maltose regulon positive regulatory protein